MKRTLSILSVVLLLLCGLAIAQRPVAQHEESTKRLVDLKGDVMYPIKVADSSAICIVGNVAFFHNGTVITCDSAIRYSDNYMECYKNVMLNKDDTYAYGDRADYNGRQNIANIYSPLIKVRNGDAVLYTHNFKFNTRTNVGEFWGMGVVFDGDNIMESVRGYFYSDQNTMVCVEKVQMRNEEYRMISDSITYNTETDEARFHSRSYIWNTKDELLTAESGLYNNQTKVYSFRTDAYILTDVREVWADTLDYYGASENVDMFGNIQIFDKEHSMMGFGDLGRYWNERGETMLTHRPSVYTYDANTNDTTFLRADTMYLYVYYPSDFRDSLATADSEERIERDQYAHLRWIDSLAEEYRKEMADSLVVVLGDMRVWMDSLKVIADSIELYANPEELEKSLKLRARRDSIAAAKIALRDSFYNLDDAGKKKFAAAYHKIRKAEEKAEAKRKLAEAKAKWEADQARIKAQIEAQRIKDKAKEDSLRAVDKAQRAADKAARKAENKAFREAKKRMDAMTPADSTVVDSLAVDSLVVDSLVRDSMAVDSLVADSAEVDSLKSVAVEKPVSAPAVVEPAAVTEKQVAVEEEPAQQKRSRRERRQRTIEPLEKPTSDSLANESILAVSDSLAVGVLDSLGMTADSLAGPGTPNGIVSDSLPPMLPPDTTAVGLPPRERPRHVIPPEAAALRGRADSVRPRYDSLVVAEGYIRRGLPEEEPEPVVLDSVTIARRDSLMRADSLRRVDSLKYFNKTAYKRILARKKELEQARKQAIKDSLQAIKDSIREAKYIAKLKAKGLWVDPDTLAVDSLDVLVPADTVAVVAVDSTVEEATVDTIQRVIRGFHNAKVYKSNLQAISDSIAAYSKDSTLVMYKDPIMWNGMNQITSKQVTFYTNGEAIERGFFEGDPIMASQVDADHFNQVAGKTMTAFFRDNNVYRNDVNSNAQALYWMQEEGSPDIIAYTTLIAADITFLLADQMVTHINGYTNSEWTLYPPEKIPDDVVTVLDWFEWKPEQKPERGDVFDRKVRPSERSHYENISRPKFPIALRINNKREHLQKYYHWVDRNDVLTEQTLEWVNSVRRDSPNK